MNSSIRKSVPQISRLFAALNFCSLPLYRCPSLSLLQFLLTVVFFRCSSSFCFELSFCFRDNGCFSFLQFKTFFLLLHYCGFSCYQFKTFFLFWRRSNNFLPDF